MADIPENMAQPIQYIERTRAYYLALGYDNPYEWARNDLCPNPKPVDLAAVKTAVVTTAAPFDPSKGYQGPGAAYNGAAKFFDVFR